mmetsp:Transcript_7520/g.18020  ORF Transcript_7520/g.18020 Transcript_7520/m.18020 type:complete len:101 (-) Transcript_7520:644-946(-)
MCRRGHEGMDIQAMLAISASCQQSTSSSASLDAEQHQVTARRHKGNQHKPPNICGLWRWCLQNTFICICFDVYASSFKRATCSPDEPLRHVPVLDLVPAL